MQCNAIFSVLDFIMLEKCLLPNYKFSINVYFELRLHLKALRNNFVMKVHSVINCVIYFIGCKLTFVKYIDVP